jgi:putative ABC transport system ATP-binding protein
MSAEPVVAVMSVTRRFGRGATEVTAVRNATLSASSGETVSIMGPSGSGKSTLLCIMGGLLVPDAGSVAIGGCSLGNRSAAALAELRRTSIGFIFQSFNLLKALTALENVELGLSLAGLPRADAQRRAAAALAEVGLAACANRLPRSLSGGEQQRVAIARALAPGPALVLADEPTGNLDSSSGRAAIEMLCAYARREAAAVVVVTHDHRVSAVVDRRLWMEDGVVRRHDHVEALDPPAFAQ